MWGMAQVDYGALNAAHALCIRSTNAISLPVALHSFPHLFVKEWDWYDEVRCNWNGDG